MSKSIAQLLFLLIVAIIVAALLAPPMFFACMKLASTGWAPFLNNMPFYRVFGRVLQICIILAFIPTVLSLKIRSFQDIGISRNPHALRDMWMGILIVIGVMALLAASLIACDIFRLRDTMDWSKFSRILLTAVFVSWIEELIFRGVLLGLLLRVLQTLPSVLISSFIFGIVHFLKPAKVGPAAEEVTWASGFAQIQGIFGGGMDGRFVIGGFVTLFIAGILLAYAAVATRSLWLPFGIHAGWIFAQQGLDVIARYRVKPPDALWPWIGPAQVSGMVPVGLLPLAALLVTCLGVWIYLLGRRRHSFF